MKLLKYVVVIFAYQLLYAVLTALITGSLTVLGITGPEHDISDQASTMVFVQFVTWPIKQHLFCNFGYPLIAC